jgi:hypothetical protein
MPYSEAYRITWRKANPDKVKAQNRRSRFSRLQYQKNNPEMRAWNDAKQRCINPNNRRYKDYGGRGIEFHLNTWRDLILLIGPRPSNKYSLDRIDNNGHYEKGNIRWATRKQQMQNRRVSISRT